MGFEGTSGTSQAGKKSLILNAFVESCRLIQCLALLESD